MIRLTDEQQKRLKEVRENRHTWYSGMGQVTRDIDFLLSLLDSDSQAASREEDTVICPVCKEEVPEDSMFSYNHVPNAFCQQCVDSGKV